MLGGRGKKTNHFFFTYRQKSIIIKEYTTFFAFELDFITERCLNRGGDKMG